MVRTTGMRLVFIAAVFCLCGVPVARGQANGPTPARSPSSAASVGQWAAPVYFCPKEPCVVGANAVVMYNGNVLFYYYPATNTFNSQAVVLNPVTGVVTNVALPVSRDIFCSGVTILSNGQVMVTGGVVESGTNGHTHSSAIDNDGTTSTMLFDPATSTWTVGQDMNYPRWYPTSVELSNGTVLELSGSNETGSWIQTALESYDITTGKWTVLPASANLPNNLLQTYPRMTLLPSGKVFLSSPAAQTYLFDPITNAWSFVAATNFGFRYFAPHVLLPGGTQ
jgi:hypothetical protein